MLRLLRAASAAALLASAATAAAAAAAAGAAAAGAAAAGAAADPSPPLLGPVVTAPFNQTIRVAGFEFDNYVDFFYDATTAPVGSSLSAHHQGQHDELCTSVAGKFLSEEPCTLLDSADSWLYLIFPLSKLCCRACNTTDFCGIIASDWLQDVRPSKQYLTRTLHQRTLTLTCDLPRHRDPRNLTETHTECHLCRHDDDWWRRVRRLGQGRRRAELLVHHSGVSERQVRAPAMSLRRGLPHLRAGLKLL